MMVRAIPIALVLAASQAAIAQSNGISGIVVSRATGEPLAHSIVAMPSLGRERFATDSGAFSFTDLPAGPVALHIRRLGFEPKDTIILVDAGQTATVRIELARVALQLGGITVRAHPPCTNPGPPEKRMDAALSAIFNQIRMNAQQFKLLSEQYPFSYTVEIVRSSRLKKDGQLRIDSHQMRRIESRASWKYKPGRVITRRGVDYVFHIPTLVDFADRDFLAQHCFHFGGTERVNDEDLIRVHVVASERIRDPDVNGTIYIDPKTYQVRRTTLRLSKISRNIRYLEDFEVTTDFREVMPSIPVIAAVSSVEKIDPDTQIAFDVAYESQKLAAFEFLKGKPGEDVRRRP